MAKRVRRETRSTRSKAKPKPRKPSTALAKRAPTTIVRRAEVLPAEGELQRTVTDGMMLGGLGLVELKLTAAEEKILSRPVNVADVRMKPTGVPYLSHPTYTKWFIEAFGRTSWALVPIGKPALSGKSVVVPYILYVHRQPVAFAQGEQEYHDNNREQTYGDALESTIASALRRCAKRLGVGLELWDREWVNDYIDRYCLRVKCDLHKGRRNPEGQRYKYLWRRKADPPFWNEVGGREARDIDEDDIEPAQRREEPRRPPRTNTGSTPNPHQPERPAGHDGHGDELITTAQRSRLWAITHNSGRSAEEVRDWLVRYYQMPRSVGEPSKEIKRRDYDFVCRVILGSEALPERKTGPA